MVRVYCVDCNPFLLFKVILRTSIKNLGYGSTLLLQRCLFALFTTPMVAGFFLIVFGDSKHKWERDIIKQEQLKESYAAERRVVEAKAKAQREKAEMKQRMMMGKKMAKASVYKSGLYESMQEKASVKERNEDNSEEKPSAKNDWQKAPTTDHSRYMPH